MRMMVVEEKEVDAGVVAVGGGVNGLAPSFCTQRRDVYRACSEF